MQEIDNPTLFIEPMEILFPFFVKGLGSLTQTLTSCHTPIVYIILESRCFHFLKTIKTKLQIQTIIQFQQENSGPLARSFKTGHFYFFIRTHFFNSTI
jgi:hypothetical protein